MKSVFYRSTRGGVQNVKASKAILTGIAEDGGLFVPNCIPKINLNLEELLNMDYKELAYFVMSKYFTDFTESELKNCIDKAYNDKFDTEGIAAIKKVGDAFVLELYHGPTLAFKDMALSILPHLLVTAAKKQNISKDIVILTATSGDTGKAALEGFTDIEGIKIIVFFPQEGVSAVQKMQMVTHKGNNTYVVGIKGNFDDAQSGVKEIFGDKAFVKFLDQNNYMFSSANSINIGRLVPQIVYYFYAYLKLYKDGEIKKGEKINITVPTGNFGNILAAYYAKEMGLPINKLICASNDNKVLYDFFNTGIYDKQREFVTTISPSMDILISSNLERLLYLLSGQDSNKVKELMNKLNTEGRYEVDKDMKEAAKNFYGNFADQQQTKEAIKKVYDDYSYLMDTHTAVAYSVYDRYKQKSEDLTKTVIASTASPYKFAYSVMNSLDDKYSNYSDFRLCMEMSKILSENEPTAIKDIENRDVLHKTICDKGEIKKQVKKILINLKS
ncbi:threonine synthase [Clostridium aestuarii]|uniref:Threonine synthase n=1 Tax=Clostridium aestuarii TaxID=338193 RepID=A0ABT4D244_9CLOT|nr:threonine synthase [Clostridium aestuarii]MCY6485325.1 threonine synthase [Clostridium aestuarii]